MLEKCNEWSAKKFFFVLNSGNRYNRRIALASSVMASLSKVWKNSHVSIPSKTRIYQALVTSVLLYAAETWTVLASDLKTLEAFHMKCQRQFLQVKWQQFVRNREITTITGLPSMSDIISRRRNAVFGHIARLDDDVPVHQALHAYVNLSLGRTPDPRWKRRPGRCRWIDQIRKDNNDTPPADVWKRAVRRGHGASLRPKLASRWTTTTILTASGLWATRPITLIQPTNC